MPDIVDDHRLTVRLKPALWQWLRKEMFKREVTANSIIETALEIYQRRSKEGSDNGLR